MIHGWFITICKHQQLSSYQIHLKIYVVLINRDRDSEEPLVMTGGMYVPPSRRGAAGGSSGPSATSRASSSPRTR